MKEIKTVLHIRGKLYDDGVTKLEYEWARALKDEFRFDFLLSQKEGNTWADRFNAFDNKVFYRPEEIKGRVRNKVNKWRYMVRLFRQYEIIHLNTDFFPKIEVLICARIAGVRKIVTHAHNSKSVMPLTGIWKYRLTQNIAREGMWYLSTERAACSLEAARWLFPAAKAEKVQIIHNGISLEHYGFNTEIRNAVRRNLRIENKYVLGHVGRFSEEKNHRFLIGLAERLMEKGKNIQLILIGNGALEKEIRRMADDRGLRKCVTFCGITEHVGNYLSAMDCFLLPSKYEGLPVVLVEAQASGLPCLVSDTVSQEAKLSDNLEYLSIADSALWEMKVMELMDLPEPKLDRESGIERVKKAKFDIEGMVSQVRDLYCR
nr:glycosyltransferase [uncultured Acetatifactor sp.]